MYVGPRGIYSNIKACFFIATKAATQLWFGMVIGIDYPHILSGTHTYMLKDVSPRGPY